MNITRGKVKKPVKLVLYGPEGIGKSTFASCFPDPLFIDTEGSTGELDVARLDAPSSWQMLLDEVLYVKTNKPCKTLIIDTADWAERLCARNLCSTKNWSGIEDAGYGKGYVYLAEEFGKMLNLLNDVIAVGINVVLTAHAKITKFEQPDEMGSYDRWELKLEKKTSPMVKEWADIVLFANYKTIAVKSGTEKNAKFKAQGGQRVMYTSHHPCWDAKNRYGLQEMLPFSYNEIKHVIESEPLQQSSPSKTHAKPVDSPHLDMAENVESGPMIYSPDPTPQTMNQEDDYVGLPKALVDLMKENRVSEQQIRKAVAYRGYLTEDLAVKDYPQDFIEGVLIGAWDKVLSVINEQALPF